MDEIRREVATIEARFAMIYNGSKNNASVALYDFGEAVAQLSHTSGIDGTNGVKSSGIINPTPEQIIAIIEASDL